MFQRGEPTPSDPHLGNFYGLAMPLIKRGLPVTPAQLENFTVTNYLNGFASCCSVMTDKNLCRLTCMFRWLIG